MQNTSPLTFEVPRSSAPGVSKKPLIIIAAVAAAGFVPLSAWTVANGGIDMILPLLAGMLAGLAMPAGMYWMFRNVAFNNIGWRAHFEDEALLVHTSDQVRRVNWDEVAKVERMRWLWRTYVWVRLYNGGVVQLCPPLREPEAIERELRARSLWTYDARNIPLEEKQERERKYARGYRRLQFYLLSRLLAFIGVTFGLTMLALSGLH
jgi:hypothetical protein